MPNEPISLDEAIRPLAPPQNREPTSFPQTDPSASPGQGAPLPRIGRRPAMRVRSPATNETPEIEASDAER